MTLDVASSPQTAEWQDDADRKAILEVDNLSISVPGEVARHVAVHGASFSVHEREAVGLVGESGSGKTLTCRAVLGVLPPGCQIESGELTIDGEVLTNAKPATWQRIHGSTLGAVFQDPASYLHPSLPVGRQLAEVLRTKQKISRRAAHDRAIELFGAIGLPHPRIVAHQRPSELSGGMLQRVMIAIAISCDPKLLVADEATTALDVVTQAEVIELLKDLRERLNLSVLFVSHDLAVVAELCDRIVVFYAGEVVEVGTTEGITDRPRHPYTDALLRVGSARARAGGSLEIIPGHPPGIDELSTGCRFAPRCSYATPECSAGPVAIRSIAPGRAVRCIRAEELTLPGTSGSDG